MKKGFTLIEMLSVIVIIGIFATTVLIGASKLIKKSNEKYYKTEESMMILAAKEYFSDYRSKLPKIINNKSKVSLETLINEEYIEIIKDVNNNNCNYKNSYVEVEKRTNRNYEYKSHLECDVTKYITKE